MKVNILGVDFDAQTFDYAIQQIVNMTMTPGKKYICVVPVSSVVHANEDPKFMEILNNADMVTMDGVPITWIAKLAGTKCERVSGPDIMAQLIFNNYGLTHGFIKWDEDHNDVPDCDILWVCLGGPKQEEWMYQNRCRYSAPVMIGVGAGIDFLTGKKPRAPKWMQKSGLEWLFRLCCEPRRLFKRYVVGNYKFIKLLLG